jgi:hypothetical protein
VRKLRKLTLSFVLFLVCISAGVFAQGKLTGYTTWDDNYFYAGFYVDDPNVTGANSKFNSNPWEDDSVEVFLETARPEEVETFVSEGYAPALERYWKRRRLSRLLPGRAR